MTVEQAAYQVLIHEGAFELRLYEPMVVVASPDGDSRQGEGFNKLFSYISGNNKESRKIEMTAPVINDLEGHHSTIAFVMPKLFHRQKPPQPNDPELLVKEVPERRLAVIRFSDAITDKTINENWIALQNWLQKKQLNATGVLELARYNPPYTPAFLRRNELMIEVKE